MRVSLKWLENYVAVPSDLKAFCDRLDLTGTGVEGVERTGDAFDHVVTGVVLEKEAHSDSDHMWVTKVDVGEDEPLQIVCGAQNFNQGDHIVVAKNWRRCFLGISKLKSQSSVALCLWA